MKNSCCLIGYLQNLCIDSSDKLCVDHLALNHMVVDQWAGERVDHFTTIYVSTNHLVVNHLSAVLIWHSISFSANWRLLATLFQLPRCTLVKRLHLGYFIDHIPQICPCLGFSLKRWVLVFFPVTPFLFLMVTWSMPLVNAEWWQRVW